MSRTLKEMAAELGMFLASIGLLACIAVAVFDLALVDYGTGSSECPPQAAGGPSGEAAVSIVPPGIRCTWVDDGATTTEVTTGQVPLALAGAVGCVVLLVVLRRVSLALQSSGYRVREPVYAEDLVDELDRRRHRGAAA